ncbi:MAG: ABC transporter permease [Bacteroidaceae bacterium]|nr:ABC transporter permease [Bacteroidaceae bacterium]MDO4994464.1 ABC transporter permease [Bacteroidales bacterium]
MGLELFIARRIYGEKSEEQRFSQPAIQIALTGIAIGLAVMVVSVFVVLGFQREVTDKVVGFGSHAQVLSLSLDEYGMLCPVVTNDSLMQAVTETEGVEHAQVFAVTQGMLKTNDNFVGVQMKGVGEDYDLSFFRRFLVEGEMPSFSADSSSNQLVLSRRIADAMQLKCGDRVFAYFVSTDNIRARRFTIAGIYETHLAEFDKVMCLTDLRTIRKLNNWKADESSGVEIRVAGFNEGDEVADCLARNINHTVDRIGALRGVFSIRQIVPHIFSWLDVLDMNVVMIIVLMMLIGGFTIVSGLLIVMLERIQMIGILKALGATNGTVRRIFRHFSVMLVGKGMLIGNVVALLLCFVQQHFGIVKLNPDTYYIDAVPIEFNWLYFLLINIGVLLISSLIIFGSSYLMSIKGPATTIRWE